MSKFYGNRHMFKMQAPATLSQAAAVQNTYYTILDTTQYVKLFAISISIDTANETLQVRLTVDGQTITGGAVACTAGQNNTIYLQCVSAGAQVWNLNIATNSYYDNFGGVRGLEMHSLKVEVQKTTALGAGTLTGTVMYGVLTEF